MLHRFDGASVGDPYKPPIYSGKTPRGMIDGGKLYTGSCHCGAITVAVMSKSLDFSIFAEDSDSIHETVRLLGEYNQRKY